MTFQPIDILGYIGMVIVVTSFFFKNIKLIRIVNMAGCVLCTIYGFITNTYPTAALNIALFIVNIIMLVEPIQKFLKKLIKNQKSLLQIREESDKVKKENSEIKDKVEEIQNKKKWMNNKGFFTSIFAHIYFIFNICSIRNY